MAALTNEDRTFINYIEQMWVKHARLPTETETKTSGFALTQWRRLVSTETFAEELYQRGIPKAAVLELQTATKDRKVLTERQLAVAAIILDQHDTRPRIKKLTESGLTTQEWQEWLLDPTFADYMASRSSKILRSSAFEADAALLAKVRQGDIRGIDYFNAYTGRFDRTVSAKSQEQPLDIKTFLIRVMESLQKHIKDTETLEAIANDLLLYANAEGFASRVMVELTPVDIPIPVDSPRHQLTEIEPSIPLPEAAGL